MYAFVKTHKTAQYKGFDYRPLKKGTQDGMYTVWHMCDTWL